MIAAFFTPDLLSSPIGSRDGFAGVNPVSFAGPTGLITTPCADLLAGTARGGSFGEASTNRSLALGRE